MRQTFTEFARACGVDIRRLRADGRIRRCPTLSHPRSTNGAYCFDGARGWVMAWDGGGETQWYGSDIREWSEADRAAWKARQEAAYAAQQIEYERAAKRAQDLLLRGSVGPHGYLRLKGFHALTGIVVDAVPRMKRRDDGRIEERVAQDVLVVPMRSAITNKLQGAQLIFREDDEWKKEMVPGMRAKGAVLVLGRSSALSILCEGYATGLSVKAAIDQMHSNAQVICCFSDSNMVRVAEMLSGPMAVAADNDASGAGEVAAKKIGRPYFMAPTVGWDANDWHAAVGLLPLCVAIREATRMA